jgi:hypothetical protein
MHHVEFWDQPAWTFEGRDRQPVTTRAIVFRESDRQEPSRDRWWVLVTGLPAEHETPASLWECYHQRGGTIEELNDQSEAGFHLDILRTSHLAGLGALHALAGLCWNLILWATQDLKLPPPRSPLADNSRWIPAHTLSLPHLLARASHCGVLLTQPKPQEPLHAETIRHNPESRAWLTWLHEPIQHQFSLAG